MKLLTAGFVGFSLGFTSPWGIHDVGYWVITMPLCFIAGFLATYKP